MNPYENSDIGPFEDLDGYQGKLFRTSGVEDLLYRIRFPENLKNGKLYPLVLVMHGSGSIGNDNVKQLFLARLFDENEAVRENSPIIVAPQCPKGHKWVDVHAWNAPEYPLVPEPTKPMASVLKLLDFILSEYPVDFTRIYVTGASMGGFASWELLFRRPGVFAGAAIVCGGCDFRRIPASSSMGIELFHGECDEVVPVQNSRRAYDILKKRDIDARYVEYPGVHHDSWIPAYADETTGKWLFSKRLAFFSTVEYNPEAEKNILTLHASGMTAKISPDAGGNLFSLRHDRSGAKLLREPHALAELFLAPVCYGIPTLFPPNRIDGGKFTFRGVPCSLPVTEIRHNNHLHGVASNRPWEVVAAGKSSATLRFVFDEKDPRYDGFPFAFELLHTYSLVPGGLSDSMTVRNTGDKIMPLGLGYHTAFPASDSVVRLGVTDREIEIGARVLPTGNRIPWAYDPSKLFNPFNSNVDFHAEAAELPLEGSSPFQGAELIYREGTLRYYTDKKFRFWYTWNSGGLADFVCFEPVSWMSNALNQTLPPEQTGVRELAPGESETFVNRFEFTPT